MAVSHIFSNPVADATGTLTIWNGATTATVAASVVVRPSDWNSAHNQFITLAGNTAGVSTVSGSNIVLEGGANATVSGIQGANVATVRFSGGAGAAGNTGYISGGTTNASLGTLSFANSNGVSWGVDGQTITATVATNYQTQGAYLTTARASNDAIGLNSALTANGVSVTANSVGLSLNFPAFLTTAMASNRGSDFVQANAAFAGTNASGTIASNGLSVSVNAQSVQPVAASAANGSYAFSTLSFSNANGISFGTSAGSAITASHNALTTAAASDHSHGNPTLALTNLTGTTASNSAGFTLSLSAGAPGGGALSVGNSNLGNTAGDTGVFTGRVVFVGSDNITLSGSSNGGSATLSIYGPSPAGGGITAVKISAGTTSNNLSALTFSDSNGISFGINASTITASHNGLTSQSNQALSGSNGSFAFQTATFGDLNGMSFYTSNGSMVGSYTVPTQTNQTLGIYAVGNTTGQSSSSTYDARTLSIDGAGIVSAGWSNGTLRISATQSNQAFSADASSTFQTLSLQDSNGISFSNNAGAIRLTHALQFTSATSAITSNALHTSVARVFNIVAATNSTAGGTASLSSNVSFSAANGITFYTSAGNAIVASHNALTSQSNQAFSADASSTFQTLSFQNSNGFTFSNNAGAIRASYSVPVVSNAIQAVGSATGSGTNVSRFAADDHVHAGVFSMGVTNAGNSAGDTRVDVGRFVLAGGANITLSQATAANGLNTISIVGGGGGGGSQSFGMSTQTAGGATAGTTGYAEGSAIRYLMVPGSNITLSQSINGSSGTISIYAPAPGAAAEANWIHALGANTAGNTTVSGSTLGFSGVNLTLSGTNNSQLVFSAPATTSMVGSRGITLSSNGSTVSVMRVGESFIANAPYMLNSVSLSVGVSTSYVIPIELRDVEEVAFLRIIQTVSLSSMASIATAANNTKSYNQQGTFNFVLYSRGIGASSQSLQSVGSTSHSSRQSINVQAAGVGSNWTVTHAYTFPATNGSTSFSTSYATTLTNVNISTTHLTALTGMKLAGFQFASTLDPAMYWMAYGFSTADTTNGNASLSNMRVTHSLWGFSQPNNSFAEFGSGTASSIMPNYGLGSFTTAGGGTTASLGFSNISSSASHVVPYLTMGRIA